MSETMKLVLLRHGESVWNKENLFTGWMDVDLSDTGRKEAAEAGKLLRKAADFSANSSTRSFKPGRTGEPSETMRGSNKPTVSPSSLTIT